MSDKWWEYKTQGTVYFLVESTDVIILEANLA